jgi:hypothetical protein
MKTKVHTTNYKATFIQIAPDSEAKAGTIPPSRMPASIAELTFKMIAQAPYKHTSDDVLFTVWATRNAIAQKEWTKARETFFSKGQPCLRASDIAKKYGWGIHSNENGKVALVGCETAEYKLFSKGINGVPVWSDERDFAYVKHNPKGLPREPDATRYPKRNNSVTVKAAMRSQK